MNISEIAKLAGVSNAAVSRYLNNGYLSEEKKAQIERVIQETGYKPSQQAKTLRTGKTKLIGMIIPKIDSSSISRIVSGVSEVLSQEGYQLILANTDNKEEREPEFIETFQQSNVEGIIHLGTIKTPKHKKVYKELSVPLVVLGQQVNDLPCIYHDDYNAAYSMTEQVLERGHRKICFIGVTEKDIAVGFNRKQGFLDAMKKYGIDVPKSAIRTGSFQMDNGYQNAPSLLESHPDLDAIICATDTISLGVIKYLNEKHIQIPSQIAVSGFGDSSAASVLSPSLATVHYYYKECGQEGARMLLDRIEHPDSPNKSVMLGFEIIPNESIG